MLRLLEHTPRRRRTLAVVLPLAAGVAMAVLFIALRTEPAADQPAEVVRSVTVIEVPAVRWRPRATGYGVARPGRTWQAIAEVPGRIVERHDELESGAILPAGTTLFRIERTDYELAVDQAEAAIDVHQAMLDDLDTRRQNLQRSLEIEHRRLAVARGEFERQQRLLEQGSVSQSSVDAERRAYLQQQRAVQEIENSLAQLPAEHRRLQAELAREQARLEQARRDLPRTSLVAPFDLRVSAVQAEVGQYVRTGDIVMQGDGVATSEVEAEVPVQQFRALLRPDVKRQSESPAQLGDLLPRMGLTASIRLHAGATNEATASWKARVDRISDAIDARTRTVGVVTVVEQPYARARPPENPPLVKGMYVEVRLCAPAREPAVVIPRAALHQGQVYLADERDRLEIREPRVLFRHGSFAVIAAGIDPGERVLVTDPVPAIAGMKLDPGADPETRNDLVATASGARDCP